MVLIHKEFPSRAEDCDGGGIRNQYPMPRRTRHEASLSWRAHPRQVGSSPLLSRMAAFSSSSRTKLSTGKKYLLQRSMLETHRTRTFLRGFNSCLCRGLLTLLWGKMLPLRAAETDFRPGAESKPKQYFHPSANTDGAVSVLSSTMD